VNVIRIEVTLLVTDRPDSVELPAMALVFPIGLCGTPGADRGPWRYCRRDQRSSSRCAVEISSPRRPISGVWRIRGG
jgi:hypothetical protein